MWKTYGDQSKLLSPEDPIEGGESQNVEWTINVDTADEDQVNRGFGAALSNAAASLIYNSDDKDQIIDELFTTNGDGIGIDYIRLVMGGSDFNAVEPYTYNDVDYDDWNMDAFTIEKDYWFTIPLLKDILQRNPDITIIGTPWTPPAWMKESRNLNGNNCIIH